MMSINQVFEEVERLTAGIFGATYVFTRDIVEDADPVNLELPDTGTPVTYSALCDVGFYEAKEIDGEVIKAGDVIFYMSLPVSTPPLIGDFCQYQSAKWRVMSIQTYINNDSITAYKLQMRK